MVRFSYVLILAAVSVQLLQAEDNRCLHRVVIAGVADEQGNPVPGLGVADFRAEFRKRPVRIVSVTPDTGPRRLVLVLDASGSMVDPDSHSWNLILSNAIDFVSRQPEQDSLALLVFASQVEEKILFTEGRKKILEALVRLQDWQRVLPKGRRKTALWDALLTAGDVLDPPQPGDAVYAITDGDDNLSRHDLRDVERTFEARGVRLFALMPARQSSSRRTPEETSGPANLLELAEKTGGNVAAVANLFPQHLVRPAELGPELVPLYRQMNEPYRLEVELPQPPDKFRSWKLEFAAPRSPKTKHAAIIYLRQLAPCAQ